MGRLQVSFFSGAIRSGASQAGAPSTLQVQRCSPWPTVQAAGVAGGPHPAWRSSHKLQSSCSQKCGDWPGACHL